MKTVSRVFAAFALSLLLSPASNAADVARLAQDCPAPDYANAWVRGDLQGSVVVAYSTDAAGRIINARLVQSSGYRQLDEASLKAVKQCKAASPTSPVGQVVSGKVRYDWQIQ